MRNAIADLIVQLDDRINYLRQEIHSKSLGLKMVAEEMHNGSVDVEGTIQVTPISNCNELELMTMIAEYNARLLVRNSLEEVLNADAEPVGDEVFLFGTVRKDRRMPGVEKMVGERNTTCTLYHSAEDAAKEMKTYNGFPFAVFRARIIIEEIVEMETPEDEEAKKAFAMAQVKTQSPVRTKQ